MATETHDLKSQHIEFPDVEVVGRAAELSDADIEFLSDIEPALPMGGDKFKAFDDEELDQCEFLHGCGLLLRRVYIVSDTETSATIEQRRYCRSVAADTLLNTLAAKQHIKSPSPETPGLREATGLPEQLRDIAYDLRRGLAQDACEKARERLFDLAAALDTPPNREGVVVLEGELVINDGDYYVTTYKIFPQGAGDEKLYWEQPHTDVMSALDELPEVRRVGDDVFASSKGNVRIEITPLGESGGEQ